MEQASVSGYGTDSHSNGITDAAGAPREDVILLRRLLAGRGALRFEPRTTKEESEGTEGTDGTDGTDAADATGGTSGGSTLLILQPFCGNGRMLIPLAEDGHVLVGLEQAPALLERARERVAGLPPSARQRVTLQAADVTAVTWPNGFDVVILGANCLGELATPHEQEKCIAAAAAALKPGGYLFLDSSNLVPARLARIPDLRRWLDRRGFGVEYFLGNYAGGAYVADSPRAIFWARKMFSGSYHEQQWLVDSLSPFFDGQWITDVLYRVKGGKEANVYCCQAHPATGLDLVAAKVYRPRIFRTMKNDAIYKVQRTMFDRKGKVVRDSRALRALRGKTEFGRNLETHSWIRNEYATLCRLHQAGADVVKPLAATDNAILMEYVGDRNRGAPTLHEVKVEPDEARRLFDRLMYNIELALECGRIHADLSAHNVLYWNGEFRIIDLPQAVDPASNPSAFFLLSRDVDRLCRYFARYGVQADPAALALDLWDRIVRIDNSLPDLDAAIAADDDAEDPDPPAEPRPRRRR